MIKIDNCIRFSAFSRINISQDNYYLKPKETVHKRLFVFNFNDDNGRVAAAHCYATAP